MTNQGCQNHTPTKEGDQIECHQISLCYKIVRHFCNCSRRGGGDEGRKEEDGNKTRKRARKTRARFGDSNSLTLKREQHTLTHTQAEGTENECIAFIVQVDHATIHNV